MPSQHLDQRGGPPKEFFAIRLFDAQTGALRWEHTGQGHWISSLAFSPDGQTIACGQGSVLLLDARTGQTTQTLKPVVGYVLGVAFSPDGRILAGCGSNTVPTGGFGGEGRVTLWDVATGAIIRTLEGPTGRAQAVAFSPDGARIAAAGTGPMTENRSRFLGRFVPGKTSEVKLWNVSTGRGIWSAEGAADAAFSLAFAPDGKTLAFCDQEYLYWVDGESGQLKQIVMETVWSRRVTTSR